ncbi:MAG TPA: hypothetical protein VGT41_06265 [Candidatus Babeliales bacterium]|nr:hypothetical protein [Candidatus Babeliales bacterium]
MIKIIVMRVSLAIGLVLSIGNQQLCAMSLFKKPSTTQSNKIKNKAEAEEFIRQIDTITWMGPKVGNLFLSMGLPGDVKHENRNKSWITTLEQVAQYIKKNNEALEPDFTKLANISLNLFLYLSDIYRTAIQPMIVDKQDKKSGIGVNEVGRLSQKEVEKITQKMKFDDRSNNALVTMRARLDNYLTVQQKAVADIRDRLDKVVETVKRATFTRKEKREAAEVLITLALAIDAHIMKVRGDYEQLMEVLTILVNQRLKQQGLQQQQQRLKR